MSVREKLQALGLELPEAPSPKGDYVPVTIHGGVAYVSGQVCRQGDSVITGPVTDQTSTELVNEAGRTCVLRALSVLDQAVGLENVERILFVRGFVFGGEGFQGFSKVVDGASQLLIELFGEHGRHARSAVGVAGLPSNGLLELELTAVVTAWTTHQNVARELAPAGLRSRPKTDDHSASGIPRQPVRERFALQREQAPSPQDSCCFHLCRNPGERVNCPPFILTTRR